MKALKTLLNESLLRGFDDVISELDDEIINQNIKDKESPFWQWMISLNPGNIASADIKRSSYENKTLDLVVPKLEFSGFKDNEGFKKYFYDKIKNIKFEGVLSYKGNNPDGQTLFADKITAKYVTMMYGGVMSNFDIDILEHSKLPRVHTGITFSDFGCKPILFKNTKINFETPRVLRFDTMLIPNLTGLTSNAARIYITSSFILDYEEHSHPFSDLFDFTYTANVYDTLKQLVVNRPMKSIKNIVALINNPKRYNLLDIPYKLKDNVKISDIFDLSGLKDVELITITNENVEFIFTKNQKTAENYLSYLKLKSNLTLLSKTTSPNSITNNINIVPKTKDGWYLICQKKFF